MNEKDNYRFLQWASFGLILIIAIAIGLFYFNSLPLSNFKKILILLLIVGIILLAILQRAVSVTIQSGKLKFKSAELRFSHIYTSEVIGIISSTLDGKIINANNSFLKMLGYSRDDLNQGKIRWDEATPPEFKAISQLAVQQLLLTGTCQPFEKQYFRKDGSRVWVMVGSSDLTGRDNNISSSYVIDVSQRYEADAQALKLQGIIKQQQDEFRSVFMNAPALITIKRGPELRYNFVNKAVIDLAGRDDHIGKTSEEMYPGALKSEDMQISRQVYETGTPRKGSRHKLIFNRNGVENEIYLDYHLVPVFDHQGNIDGVATFGFDVTDLVKANQEMEISKNRFSFIADSLPHKVLMLKPNGFIEYLNDNWLSYLSISEEDAKDMLMENIVHPDNLPEMNEKWLISRGSGEDFNMELRLKRGDGNYRLHSTRAIALKDSTGEVVTWIGLCQDIHDQQEQFKQLTESELYFRAMSDDSPFMIWKSDFEGSCTYVNKTWIRVTGLSYEESMGYGFAGAMEIYSEEEKARWQNAVRKKSSYDFKFRLRTVNSELRWVLAQSNPYYIDGNFAGYVGSIADIHDQEELALALKESSEKKDEFISIASHELKTPLTSIKGFTQILLKNLEKEDKSYAFGNKILEHCVRLENLITDLLDVSKINAGKLTFEKSDCNLNSLIKDGVENIQYLASDHEIIVETVPDLSFYGDKYRLEQVLNNFLTNAIKYSPDSSRIIVKSQAINGDIKINVQDEGIGISPSNLNKLFERFFRADDISMRFQGLGLGLYISAQIVKQHNGKIGVESTLGKGSNFWFTIPIEEVKLKLRN